MPIFFESWSGVLRVIIAGALAYTALLVLLRVSGKRSLSKLNAFDLVVTVALGSSLATVVLSKDVPLVEGFAAFGLLILAQYAITAASVRSRRIRTFVKSTPRLLVFRGKLLHDAMREERVTVEEIYAVVRGSGKTSIRDVGAVVLETDASLHVLGAGDEAGFEALKTVAGAGDGGSGDASRTAREAGSP